MGLLGAVVLGQASGEDLLGAKPLDPATDRSEQIVAGIDRYLDRATAESAAKRSQYWKRDFTSPQAYAASVAPNRERLRTILGAIDPLLKPVRLDYISGPDEPALIAESDNVRVREVRWTVFEGVHGEGLLLQPKRPAIARVVALPDADQTPESAAGIGIASDRATAFAMRLAEAGCEVLMPALIDRQCTASGNPAIAMTDQPHREWIWRQAFELGRHVIGFEVQKVAAAIDWWSAHGDVQQRLPIAVAGCGEGGLIALCAAALDTRIDAALVSGFFGPREGLWSEPIYRNVWGLLREFGDAEIASLIAPRALIVEHTAELRASTPTADSTRKKTAAPGTLQSPRLDVVRAEVERARKLSRNVARLEFIEAANDEPAEIGSREACEKLIAALGIATAASGKPSLPAPASEKPVVPARFRPTDPAERQTRQVRELTEHCQRLLRRSEQTRREYWQSAVPKNAEEWPLATRHLKQQLWTDVFGRLPDPSLPLNPRAHILERQPAYTLWEVTLDVWQDVFAWGYLLIPNGIKPNEQRPAVVCQHGLEGLPASVINDDPKSRDWTHYRAYARRLAERGFICFCPHNPYRGGFRPLQRKANPLGLTLFSFIAGMHQRELDWLKSLPFVDAKRIGFYGLSYGGVSAVRLPALLEGYSLSICSAAFNDWARKIASTEFRASYLFTAEHEQFSFNLANTFSNAELAALIAPRPFMVERGHRDGVAPDEWVAHEYAKVRRLYAELGIPGHTQIEFFMGGHEIHGQGTFDFLHRHLDWPK